MTATLTTPQGTAATRDEFRDFVDRVVVPVAGELHRSQRTPPELIATLADAGLLGLPMPARFGGGGADASTLGVLARELGRGCSSLRSLLTVHTMVAHTIARWGSTGQQEHWLPRLAGGAWIAALALSEPDVGSDASAVATTITDDGDAWRLDGHKKWITYGAVADLFLVIGASPAGPTALLVPRDTAGLHTDLITGLIGIRGSMTADVWFDDCRVPKENLVARPGFGVSHVAGTALDLGRYTVACGSLGILDACLAASVGYANERVQFGVPIKEHQLVRRMITDMYTDTAAAAQLCAEAGRLRDAGHPGAVAAASTAKYFASTAAVRAASDAVQIHGANGASEDYPVQRLLGDAKVMEIIEGSTQLQQTSLAEYAFQEFAVAGRRTGRS